VELFGTKYDSPIFISPTGGNKFFHPDGESAVARAARVATICKSWRRRRTIPWTM
jgi:isopentenyl diphosphate isomerase/L-lactate dehydrogenase-like FMN-dependent dehydrogenase